MITRAANAPSNQAVLYAWTDFGQRQVLVRHYLSTKSGKQQARNALSYQGDCIEGSLVAKHVFI